MAKDGAGCLDVSRLAQRVVHVICQGQGSQAATPSASSSSSNSKAGVSAAEELFALLRRERGTLRRLEHEGKVLEPDLEAALRCKLDQLQAHDLAVHPRDTAQLAGSTSGVGYKEIHHGPELTLCVFVLRAGARIPLHDHPGMQVFGRLLYGRMRVKSFDPEPLPPLAELGENRAVDRGIVGVPPPGTLWARLRSDQVVGPAPTTFALGPVEGNLHELQAVDDCAFFDVVAPPYDQYAGRDCTYYAAAPPAALAAVAAAGSTNGAGATEKNGEARRLLVPVRLPGFCTQRLEYEGPPFLPAADKSYV